MVLPPSVLTFLFDCASSILMMGNFNLDLSKFHASAQQFKFLEVSTARASSQITGQSLRKPPLWVEPPRQNSVRVER
jgi:hypothetical protein